MNYHRVAITILGGAVLLAMVGGLIAGDQDRLMLGIVALYIGACIQSIQPTVINVTAEDGGTINYGD